MQVPVLHHLLNISISRPCCWVLWMWTEPRAISLVWVYKLLCFAYRHIVQELCESRGGRPGLSVLTSLLVSVDVKIY